MTQKGRTESRWELGRSRAADGGSAVASAPDRCAVRWWLPLQQQQQQQQHGLTSMLELPSTNSFLINTRVRPLDFPARPHHPLHLSYTLQCMHPTVCPNHCVTCSAFLKLCVLPPEPLFHPDYCCPSKLVKRKTIVVFCKEQFASYSTLARMTFDLFMNAACFHPFISKIRFNRIKRLLDNEYMLQMH